MTRLSTVARRSMAAVAVASLTLAACGGSDDAGPATDSGGDAAATTVAGSDSGTDSGSNDDFSPTGDSDSDFCKQVRTLDETGGSEDDDFAKAEAEFEKLIDSAPDDIRGDVETVVDALRELEKIDENDPESFEKLLEVFDRPEVVQASDRLETYGVEVCGLEPAQTIDTSDLEDFDLGDLENGTLVDATTDELGG